MMILTSIFLLSSQILHSILPHLKAFDHIDDDDSGYISKEVSSSVSDRIQVSQIRLLMPVIPFPPFSGPYQIAWGKCITFSNREAHQGG